MANTPRDRGWLQRMDERNQRWADQLRENPSAADPDSKALSRFMIYYGAFNVITFLPEPWDLIVFVLAGLVLLTRWALRRHRGT